MDNHIPWGRIYDYLLDTSKEIDPVLQEWISRSAENKEFLEELTLLRELPGKIPVPITPDVKRAWRSVERRIWPNKFVRHLLPTLSRVAAALAFVIIGFAASLFIKTENELQVTRIFSPDGSKTHVLLPDSSEVVLNGGTSLTYANNFSNERSVGLDGEALFNVRKNASVQFTVATASVDINVFGTEFNVKNYEQDATVEIGLKEGSVGLSKSGVDMTRLSPGQIAVLDKRTGKVKRFYGNIDKIISWSLDELIFEDMTFKEIATYLERWYGVEIYLSPKLELDHRYTFRVKTESIRELLELINVITPISYKIDGRKISINKK